MPLRCVSLGLCPTALFAPLLSNLSPPLRVYGFHSCLAPSCRLRPALAATLSHKRGIKSGSIAQILNRNRTPYANNASDLPGKDGHRLMLVRFKHEQCEAFKTSEDAPVLE